MAHALTKVTARDCSGEVGEEGGDETWSRPRHLVDENTQTSPKYNRSLVGPPDAFASLAQPLPIRVPVQQKRPLRRRLEADSSLVLPERYQDLGCIGRGGMGEVRRVLDRLLCRVVAMKLLKENLSGQEVHSQKFMTEAQVTAQLEHASIIPVYDVGRLPDGRCYFTMREVSGQTLKALIQDVHKGKGANSWGHDSRPSSFHLLIESFLKVCEAVDYAHQRGVVHQDLKPSNIMVAAPGDVLVLDWGIAKLQPFLTGPKPLKPVMTDIPLPNVPNSGALEIYGTPAYMAPEKAEGNGKGFEVAGDIYALGAILYCILAGRSPYIRRGGREVVEQLLAGPPPPPSALLAGSGNALGGEEYIRSMPRELIELCQHSMARNVLERPTSVQPCIQALRQWLDGSIRDEKVKSQLSSAERLRHRYQRIFAEIKELKAEASELGSRSETEDEKSMLWELGQKIERLQRGVRLKERMYVQVLQNALAIDPDSEVIHQLVADFYFEKHRELEGAGEEDLAYEYEILLRRHDRSRRYAEYLSGEGRLFLTLESDACTVHILRYVTLERRLQLKEVRRLGPTDRIDIQLPHGSYLLRVSAPNKAQISVPLVVERPIPRGQLTAPDEGQPRLLLPPRHRLSSAEVYVAAGPFISGGDKQLSDSLPHRRIWVNSFVIQRFAVSHQQYLAFINALVAGGEYEGAKRHSPRAGSEAGRPCGPSLYNLNAQGLFSLADKSLGRRAVTGVTWHAAMAYAAWYSELTGRTWRLPGEFEWEKAARGVDGRYFPWGNHFDASWAGLIDRTSSESLRPELESSPLDESPYGVRGMSGNVIDWCLDVYQKEGPEIRKGSYEAPTHLCKAAEVGATTARGSSPDGRHQAVLRGGSWYSAASHLRCAHRFAYVPSLKYVGFRLLTTDFGD